MILSRPETSRHERLKTYFGSLSHLALFAWSLLVVFLTGNSVSQIPVLIALLVLALSYPASLHRLMRLRWLFLFVGIVFITLLFGDGDKDLMLWGLPFASQDLSAGFQMVLRAFVILVAADGLSASINITEVAGIFERFGMQGLGFSLGVAVNIIPTIRDGARSTWHSLRMRGGLRSHWWRGLQLYFLTVLTNGLCRSEDIVLAAEARAFSPNHVRSLPLRAGRLDWLIVALATASLFLFLVGVS